MLFNSLPFFAFLAIVIVLYAVLGKRAQDRLLLLASFIFYASWSAPFLLLLVTTILVD